LEERIPRQIGVSEIETVGASLPNFRATALPPPAMPFFKKEALLLHGAIPSVAANAFRVTEHRRHCRSTYLGQFEAYVI
jgi:hypothetical protein